MFSMIDSMYTPLEKRAKVKFDRDDKAVEFMALATKMLKEAVAKIKHELPHIDCEVPEIFVADIPGTTLGQCFYDGNTRGFILLHRKYLDEFDVGYIQETGLHELAHWIVCKIYGSYNARTNSIVKPHGREFRYIMSLLGKYGKAARATRSSPNADYSIAKMRHEGINVDRAMIAAISQKFVHPRTNSTRAVLAQAASENKTVAKPAPGKQMRYAYSCSCNGRVHWMTTVSHNRIMRKERSFMCIHCNAVIAFKN